MSNVIYEVRIQFEDALTAARGQEAALLRLNEVGLQDIRQGQDIVAIEDGAARPLNAAEQAVVTGPLG